MESNDKLIIGMDVGSVSVNTAVLDKNCNIYETDYIRHFGQPIETVIISFQKILDKYGSENISGVSVTGSAGEIISELLGASFNNEVITVTKAISKLYPYIRTVIELGGEDSKYMLLDIDHRDGNSLFLKIFQ